MKRYLKKDIAVFLVLTFAIATWGLMPAYGSEEKPSADFSVSALSAYIWRGFELSRDSIVIQPSTTVSYRGFSANLWGNLDTEPYIGDDSSNWTETDWTLSYGRQFGPVGAELGYIYYALDGVDDSQEVFLSLGLDTLLAPTLTVYKEFDHYPSWYILFGISHAFEITDTVSLELSGSASYLASDDKDAYPEINGGEATDDEFSDFHDGTIAASLPISVSEYVTVTPSIAYTFALTGDASDQMEAFSQDGDDDSYIYGGVTVSFAF